MSAASSFSTMAAAAATTIATSYSSSSPNLHNKISNLYFLPSPPIPKPLTYRTINHPNYSPIFYLISHSSPYRAFSTAFDDSVIAEEDSESPQDDDDEEKQNGSQLKDLGKLYVGNLPYSMTSTQLVELFGEAGRVDSVEIVYDRLTDRSRGFAFVKMNSVDDAKEAIRMFNGAQVGGRTVKVNFPEVPKGREREVMGPKIRNSYQGFVDTPHKIYAGNLDWRLTSEGLKDAFADQPGILSAKVIYSRDSGKSRGFGFVSFASAEEVDSALNAMNGVEVEGRPLRLNLASERASPAPSLALERRNTANSLESSEMLLALAIEERE